MNVSAVANWPGSYFGLAWGQRIVPTPCYGPTVVPAIGAPYTSQTTVNGPTYFDGYSGWGFDQSGRERTFQITLPAMKDLTVTDTNPQLDIHIVSMATCNSSTASMTVMAQGADSAIADNLPAGTYYIVVDGRDGSTGTFNLNVQLTGP